MKTNNIWRALLVALVIVALAAVVVGCGDDDGTSGAGNKTDVAFVTDMTAHHQGAIDMARLARKKAEHAEIRTLANDVIAAQQAEIETMEALMDDMHDTDMHGSDHMGMSDHEMGMDMDMTALESAEPFDKAFIDAMVPHHEGAIAMAKAQLAEGSQPELRKMADDIIAAQTEEIARMKAWRKAWYGAGSD